MLLFSFLLLPLLITWFCFYYKNRKVSSVIVFGAFAAILVCGFRAFFTFSHRIIPYDFTENFIYLLVRQALLPSVLLYLLFFLISKDDFKFKTEMFLPLEWSFYSIYLPYVIISSADGLYSWFDLFFKPALFAAMILQCGILVKYFYFDLKAKKIFAGIIFALIGMIYICLPAIFESLFLMDSYTALIVLLGAVYILLPFVFVIIKQIKLIKEEN